MKKIFKFYGLGIILLLVLWWLNMPFFDSHNDIDYKIVTENALLENLIYEMVGPEIEINSLIKRNDFQTTFSLTDKDAPLINNADLIILNGFNADLISKVNQFKKKDTRIISLKKTLKLNQSNDEYFWMSIKKITNFLNVIQTILNQEIPEFRSQIKYRKNAYFQSLKAMFDEVSKKASQIDPQKRVLASYHDSMVPLAANLNVKYIDLSIVNPSKEEYEEKMSLIKENNIDIIYQVFGVDDKNIDELIKYSL